MNLLLSCKQEPFYDKVFLCKGNIRRWIPSGYHADFYGLDLSNTIPVDKSELFKYQLSAPIALTNIHLDKIQNVFEMKQYLCSSLSGYGIEFGAATNPTPLPLSCSVDYADLFINKPGDSRYYQDKNIDFVTIKYQTSLDNMDCIANNSLDFVIACHVIEHVRNPLLAIEKVWNKLKSGSKFVLVIPHRNLTFDSKRSITPLEHIIEDYSNFVVERDILHYVDFFTNAFPVNNLYHVILESYENPNTDIHFHTWDERSFSLMIDYFSKNIRKWSNVEIYQHLNSPDAYEFYAILTK